MRNNIIVKDTWIMPKTKEETTLTLQEPSDLLVGCWLWNPSVGYLEVTKYSGYDINVTVKNLDMEENAREGSVFPGCMEMLVIAPNATPILDNNITCLDADFISPSEGNTALMKVVDSSAIKAADLIIVDNKYQYVVIQVIDEHTLEVLNEGKGAEGIIKVDCTGCVSVKIFESTYCCKVLQEEVDDIYDTLNDRHSIKAWTGNNLVTISGGDDSLISSYDVTVKVDNDLSKYDNTVSKFTSLLYFKEDYLEEETFVGFVPNKTPEVNYYYAIGFPDNPFDYANITKIYCDYLEVSNNILSEGEIYSIGDISTEGTVYSDNSTMNSLTLNGTTYTSIPSALEYFEETLSSTSAYWKPINGTATYYYLGSFTDSFNKIYADEIQGGFGKHSHISFGNDGSDTVYSNGTSNSYNAHAFYSGGKKVFTIGYDEATSYINIIPNGSNLTIGNSGNTWSDVYTVNINGSPYSPSDEVKKENIVKSKTSYLESIKSLETYKYNYKYDDKTTHLGIMAQDVQKIEPLCVVDRANEDAKETDLYIDVMGYITILTECIKELAQDVSDLKKALTKGDDNEYKEVSEEK